MNAINSRNDAHLSHLATTHRADRLQPGSRPTLGRFAQAGALVALGIASAACSSVSAATPPVAPSAPVSPVAAAVCHPTSAAKVLARRVFVPRGVEASADDGAFSVRFAPDSSHCVAVEWPSGTQRLESGSCPPPGTATASRANGGGETMLAWESRDEAVPHIDLGVVTYDAPRAFFGFGIQGERRLVERPFHAPAANAGVGETAPALAAIGHDRFLLAWVAGNSESHQLRAQSVVGWGDPLGPAMVLSPSEASVIGRPSVVVEPTGYGLVTYLASIEGEFDVLATPVSCAMN
jgi:hypothetical protein